MSGHRRCAWGNDGTQCAELAMPRRGRTGRRPRYCAVHRREVTRENKNSSARRILESPCSRRPDRRCRSCMLLASSPGESFSVYAALRPRLNVSFPVA